MANNIQLDEGASGKYSETLEVTSNVHAQMMIMRGVTACKLTRNGTVCQTIVCTTANVDYAMSVAMVSGTKYLVVYCAAVCKVAMGLNTTATNGVMVAAGIPTVFPVTVTGTSAYDMCHVQSATAGAAVTFTSMSD